MKKRKTYNLFSVLLVMIVTLSAVCLAGCGARNEAQGRNIKIGLALYDASDTFIKELTDEFEKDIKDLNSDDVTVSVQKSDSENSQIKQNSDVEQLISDGVDVLCVNLVDRNSPSEIIDAARKNDIPIVFFNREPVHEDMMQWDRMYYVGSDAEQSGVLQGEMAADDIKSLKSADRNHDGSIQYVVLEGQPNHQDALIRTDKSVSAILESGIRLDNLGTKIANWNRAQAQSKMKEFIDQYGTKIELVLANNDDMALGAIDAYNKTDYVESDRPLIYGVDGTEVGLEAVLSSQLNGTVYNDKESQAEYMCRASYELATGGDLSDLDMEDGRFIYTPFVKVNKDNAADYLKR